MGYIFEWDAEKAESNARKRGVTFDDPDHSLGEERYLVLGMSNRQRLLVVAVAERPPRTRLISARRAARSERRRYEEEG